jgi:hypothetical protein
VQFLAARDTACLALCLLEGSMQLGLRHPSVAPPSPITSTSAALCCMLIPPSYRFRLFRVHLSNQYRLPPAGASQWAHVKHPNPATVPHGFKASRIHSGIGQTSLVVIVHLTHRLGRRHRCRCRATAPAWQMAGADCLAPSTGEAPCLTADQRQISMAAAASSRTGASPGAEPA